MVLQALSSYGLKFKESFKGVVTVTNLESPYETIDVDISDERSILLQTVEVSLKI